MKKLFVIFCLLLTYKAQSQNSYHPAYRGGLSFVSNTKWCVEEFVGTGSTTRDYVATKDTIFGNGHTYREYGGNYFVREDTAVKKVWIVWPGSVNETLLYDFSLQPGDSFKVHYIRTGWNVTYHLDSVKALTILAGTTNEFFFSTIDTPVFSTFKWIEEIGAETSPFYPVDPTAYENQDPIGYCLIAALSDTINYLGSCMIAYFYPQVCADLPFNSVIDLSENNFTIYPNPSSGEVYIQRSDLSPAFITVYNTYGKTLAQTSAFGGTTSLDFSSYPPGIYFVRITQNNSSIIKKVCKD